MQPLTKTVARIARWIAGRSHTGLPPWTVDAIQHGALGYSYKGIPMLKDPFDLALYALLIGRLRPRTIIEIGTYKGGATTWLADQQTINDIDGVVHSLDVIPVELAPSPRVVLHRGSARELVSIFPADWIASLARPLLVIDDGDHSRAGVLAVLEHFSGHLHPGEYMIVEDGSAADLGLAHKMDGGPLAAIHEFLGRGAPFEIDRSYCDFYGRNMTWNIDGYLRRI